MLLTDLDAPPETLATLSKANIHTVSHLLSHPNPSSLLPHLQLTNLYTQIHAATATLPTRPTRSETTVLTSSCQSLNAALGGGLPAHSLIQLVGASGSGKTQLALSFAATALQNGHGVIWLDTSCTAIALRVRQMLKARGAGQDDVEGMLKRLGIVATPTLERTIRALESLREDVKLVKTAGAEWDDGVFNILKRLRLVVMDSVAGVLHTVLGLRLENGWSGHVGMIKVVYGLRWLARECECSVVVTNRLLGGRAALGNFWNAAMDGVIQENSVTLKRGKGGRFAFEIAEQGAVDKAHTDEEDQPET